MAMMVSQLVPFSAGEVLAQDMLQTRLRYDEPLSRHTTFRIGGRADLFVTAESEEELLALVTLARKGGIDFLLLGAGSNVLVSDRGVRGLVILNRASDVHFISGRVVTWTSARARLSSAEVSVEPSSGHLVGSGDQQTNRPTDQQTIRAASGALLGHLARQAAQRGLGGLEWAVGIPGTLGGAIVQNAGAHGSCMADVVIQARVLTCSVAPGGFARAGRHRDGVTLVRTLALEELALGYRTSRFRCRGSVPRTGAETPSDVILSADLGLSRQPRGELEARMVDYIAQRRAAQPWLPSAGSVFKNPPGDYAARLIEEAGLKGMRQGDAMIAPEHANFIVNIGNAQASDVKTVIDRARTAVAQRFGVELELEIQLVGDWHESCGS